MTKIGFAYELKGNYQKQLENYEICRQIKLSVLGKGHPYYANALNNMGLALKNICRYEEAIANL